MKALTQYHLSSMIKDTLNPAALFNYQVPVFLNMSSTTDAIEIRDQIRLVEKHL